VQAIREVLLSDEFMTAFAAAFRSEAVSQYTFSDEVRSLEHPIPGVNRPMRSEAQLSQMVDMVRQSLTTETVNSPKTLGSSNPSESLNSSTSDTCSPWVGDRTTRTGSEGLQREIQGVWIEPTPKPLRTQPPTGYRFLTKQDFHAKLDEFINATGKREAVPEYLIGQRASVVEPHGWIRRCEFERGERVTIQFVDGIYVVNGKEPGHIDCYSVQLDGFSSRRCRTVDAKNLIPLEQPTPPTKQYREPTPDDLANGPIECEYREHDGATWRNGFLAGVIDAEYPFQIVSEDGDGHWEQCRIEVAE
jgi:hypothetical protein